MDQVFLNSAFVEIFLIQNPYFLDEFIRMHVSKERIEKWLNTKTLQDVVVSDTSIDYVAQALNVPIQRPLFPRLLPTEDVTSLLNFTQLRRNVEPRVTSVYSQRRSPDPPPMVNDALKQDDDPSELIMKKPLSGNEGIALADHQESLDPQQINFNETRSEELDCLVPTNRLDGPEFSLSKSMCQELENISAQQTEKEKAQKKGFQCKECQKCFTCNSKLQRHQVTHTGERNYKCEDCGKKFTQPFNLKAHMRIHQGTQPAHLCDICNKTFTKKIDLRLHKRIHTGEMPEKCMHCGMRFTFKQSLNAHLRVHTNERPYKCDQCERSFTQSSNLKKHQLIHSNLKPFRCSLCNMDFRQSSNLKKHQKRHHANMAEEPIGRPS